MTEAEQIAALIERVEAAEGAEGADRNLDAMIHYWRLQGVGCGMAQDAPAYTASIDAALTLLPEGCERNMRLQWTTDLKEQPCVIADLRWRRVRVRAPTPALALVAACLRALLEQENKL